ncbi:MAG: pyridoxal-phosphate dependent enzyme [Ilumatobacteraceae bacterium]|jgi:threonine dehydratase|nr:pyridoxal-phosphate dependent enzyme [Ilumatobacteraceae bacterium]
MAAIPIDSEVIEAARLAGIGVVKRTPITESATLSERYGGNVVFKAENLQRTGSFKIRGAMSKLASLGDAVKNGVVAGSAGNHAQSIAFAARHHNVPCEIFVPAGASLSKMEAARSYGAILSEGGDTLSDAVAAAQGRADAMGMNFCHPYDDPVVVAGQATLGLELLEDISDLSLVIIPLGGGGLTGGVAMALKTFNPKIRVIGVQVRGCAPYAGSPPPDGPIVTLADGIAVKMPGVFTRPLIERYVDEIVVVEEDLVADAMVLLMDRGKLYVEGGGAVGVSALMSGQVKPAQTGTTCVVLSGGNVDLGLIPGLIRRNETKAGRRLILFVRISDRPGGLARLLTLFAETGANLVEVEHVREGVSLHVRETGIQAVLEVRSREQADEVLAAVRKAGYEADEVEAG